MKNQRSQVQWCTPIIPTIGEAQAGGLQIQGLGSSVKSCLKKKFFFLKRGWGCRSMVDCPWSQLLVLEERKKKVKLENGQNPRSSCFWKHLITILETKLSSPYLALFFLSLAYYYSSTNGEQWTLC